MITLNTCYTMQFYTGLQADTKPLGVPNGSMFLEMDTAKLYRFDAENQTWIDQANPTPSGGNDMFIIHLSYDDDTYTVDKTYEEILAAVEDGQLPIVVYQEPTHTNIFYYFGTISGDESDMVGFSTIPVVFDGGVQAYSMIVDDSNVVTYVESAYPGD